MAARLLFSAFTLDSVFEPRPSVTVPNSFFFIDIQTAEDEVQRLQGTLMAMDQVIARRSKAFTVAATDRVRLRFESLHQP